MKPIYFLLLLSLFATTSFGQNTIAQLKYEDAEVAFTKEDYATTLTKLVEAEKILGSSNRKILYLKIMAQSKLIEHQPKTDLEQMVKAKQDIDFYLKNYDKGELDDKYRDVYRVSEKFGHFAITVKDIASAEKGDLPAMQKLGDANYFTGNYDKALGWYEKLAAKNNKHGLFMAGYLYDYGFVMQDYEKAFQLYSQAEKLDMPLAEYGLAWMHYHGQATVKDTIKAAAYFAKAIPRLEAMAKQGNIFAKTTLAGEYLEGRNIAKNESKALEYNTPGLDAGDPKAFYQAGDYHLEVTKDYAKAKAFTAIAAEKEYPHAMMRMAYWLDDKKNVENLKQAQEWATKAANKGDVDAMFWLANSYLPYSNDKNTGRVITTPGGGDTRQAYYWYEKAGDKGNGEAAFKAGIGYVSGLYGKIDQKRSAELMKISADNGHVPGMTSYAGYNLEGKAIPQNYTEAHKYYNKAAENGSRPAMEALANMYEKGQGVPKDKEKAKEWRKKAKEKKMDNAGVMNMIQIIGR
jgi:TPR repeat protein